MMPEIMLGAYLYQISDGEEQPIRFLSKLLSGPQLREGSICGILRIIKNERLSRRGKVYGKNIS